MKKFVLMFIFLIILLAGCAPTVLKIKGENIEAEISPAKGNTIKETVTITVTKAPADTKIVSFSILPEDAEEQTMIPTNKLNVGIDDDGGDGWSYVLDTTNLENGDYLITIYTLSLIEEPSGQAPPEELPKIPSTDKAEAKIIIRNG